MNGTLALWLLPLLPLAGGSLLLLANERWARAAAGPLSIVLAALVIGLSLLIWPERPAVTLSWLPYAGNEIALTLNAAAANAPLALLVASITFLVLIYSQGYLDQSEARSRFFGLMLLFLGGMEWLVLADDLLTLLLGWELVGACSYALIGFWHSERKRVCAALRAFVTTRSADLGLYLAALAAFAGSSAFTFDALPGLPQPWLNLAALGVVLAALGKSAQLPFSGWLSGAMQGPTPVSALLHSATMVAAGAILLVKSVALLAATTWALPLVLWLGVVTALLGGVIALYQKDLKQLLAASTISQYGYIFAAIGVGLAGVGAGLTHLVNHAAYKALLFLAAGVLLHQGMRRFRAMGGLRQTMPLTATLFALAALALAALPPLGGFFSKETVLGAVAETHIFAFWFLLVASLLSAAYAARAWFAAFSGPARSDCARDAHDPNAWFSIPMGILGAAALLLGALALPPLKDDWVNVLAAESLPHFSWIKAALALIFALAAVVWVVRRHRRGELVPLRPIIAARFGRAAYHWFGLVKVLDAIGHATLALARTLDRLDRSQPTVHLAAGVRDIAKGLRRLDDRKLVTWPARLTPTLAMLLAGFDRSVIDRLVTGAASGSRQLAGLSRVSDQRLIDGGLHWLTRSLQASAAGLSHVQSGLLYRYYLFMTLGLGALLLYALVILGV